MLEPGEKLSVETFQSKFEAPRDVAVLPPRRKAEVAAKGLAGIF